MMETDFELRRLTARKQKLLDEIAQFGADLDHWNRTHPNDEQIVFPPLSETVKTADNRCVYCGRSSCECKLMR